MILYDENDNLIELQELKNVATDSFVNDASPVTVTIVDADGGEVLAATAMAYVAASDGKYRATIQDTLAFTVGLQYTAQIAATGDGLQFYAEEPLTVVARTAVQ